MFYYIFQIIFRNIKINNIMYIRDDYINIVGIKILISLNINIIEYGKYLII